MNARLPSRDRSASSGCWSRDDADGGGQPRDVRRDLLPVAWCSCQRRWIPRPASLYSRKMPSSADSGRKLFREEPPPEREIDVLRRALAVLRECVPATWRYRIEEEARRRDVVLDALVILEAPDGSSATLAVEANRLVATRDVPDQVERLRSMVSRAAIPSAVPMLVARYLPPSTRERLERDGVAYADATGNVRVAIDHPALFVRNVGEDHDPWRGPGRPRGTLKGAPAARVVRALVDFSPPYTIPRLIERSGASTGATYRVVEFLEEEDLLERKPRGPITAVAWRRLIERWSQDYGFQRSDVVQSFLFPRGVEAIPEALRSTKGNGYVLTGSLAAQSLAPYAPPRLAMIYVTDILIMTDRLGLRAVDKGANVLLAANRDDVSFIRAHNMDGVVTAAPSQIAVDLLTAPGRSPSEGRALLDWMEADEQQWRR